MAKGIITNEYIITLIMLEFIFIKSSTIEINTMVNVTTSSFPIKSFFLKSFIFSSTI